MKRLLVLIIGVLGLSMACRAAEYTIDPNHSKVIFRIKHLSISTVTGHFPKFSWTFDVDPANLKNLKASATIETASIDTAVPDRDKHLKGPDFFDAEKFPQMSFVGKEIKDVQGNKLSIAGDLTMRGITKPVILSAEFGGAVKDPWGNERAAFTATAAINRKDFGMTWNKTLDAGGLMLGEEVQILIEV